MLQNNDSFELKYLTGKVLAYDTTTRFIKVFIPKMTPSLYQNEIKEYTTSTNVSNMNIKNSLSVDAKIKHSNVVTCRPFDYTQKMPDINSYVEVIPFDDDISKLLWHDPVAVNENYYSVIADEKYDKLVTININDVTYEIKSEDKINIEVPDSFKLTLINEDKTKTFKLSENIGNDVNSLKDELSDLKANMNIATEIYRESLLDLLKCNVFESIAEKYNSEISANLNSCTNFSELYTSKNKINKFNNALNAIKTNIDKLTNVNKNDTVSTINEELLLLNSVSFDSYENILNGLLTISRINRNITLYGNALINDNYVLNPSIDVTLDDNILTKINEYIANNAVEFKYDDNHEYSAECTYSGSFIGWYTKDGKAISNDNVISDDITVYPAYVQLIATYTTNNTVSLSVEYSFNTNSGKVMLTGDDITIYIDGTKYTKTTTDADGNATTNELDVNMYSNKIATITYNNIEISLTL